MRSLASIQKIEWISPIEGKDLIVLAGILGWQVIVRKDEYQVGDLTVFCEIDSVFPSDDPNYEFLKSKNFRIRTMKMGGVLSQGICFPLSILPKGKYKIGDDVTYKMKIVQYIGTQDRDPGTPKRKMNKFQKFFYRFAIIRKLFPYKKEKRGIFPDFISKTDETRIQNIPKILENKEILYTETEKIDGTSGTYFLKRNGKKFEFGICSRNLRLPVDDGSVYWQVAKKYGIEDILKALITDEDKFVCLQGEIPAPSIQKNKYGLSEPKFFGFNFINSEGRWGSVKAKELLAKYNIEWVPIINERFVLPDTVNELLEHVDGKSLIGDCLREGSVFRSLDGKTSFKAVSPEFLIKNKE